MCSGNVTYSTLRTFARKYVLGKVSVGLRRKEGKKEAGEKERTREGTLIPRESPIPDPMMTWSGTRDETRHLVGLLSQYVSY